MLSFSTIVARTVIALFAFVCLSFLGEMLANANAYTHKVGRVVDANTGKGMPDVAVIAAATSSGINFLGGSGHNTLYRYITHTDANGDYSIPSMWSHAAIWLPLFNEADVHWTITTLKPGYAIVGDEKTWDFDEKIQGYLPASMHESPSALWLGFVVRASPIRMYPIELSLKAAGIYYREMYVVGAQFEDTPEEVALRKPTFEYLKQRICAEEPNTQIDSWTTEGVVDLSWNPSKVLETLRASTPDVGYSTVTIRAGDLCGTIKGDQEPRSVRPPNVYSVISN